MGSLVVRLKVLPSEVGLDLNRVRTLIEASLPVGMSIISHGEEPIAFGLVALILNIELEEKEGMMERLENAVRGAPSVSQIDVLGVSRKSAKL